jgi:hypothetical protein
VIAMLRETGAVFISASLRLAPRREVDAGLLVGRRIQAVDRAACDHLHGDEVFERRRLGRRSQACR